MAIIMKNMKLTRTILRMMMHEEDEYDNINDCDVQEDYDGKGDVMVQMQMVMMYGDGDNDDVDDDDDDDVIFEGFHGEVISKIQVCGYTMCSFLREWKCP